MTTENKQSFIDPKKTSRPVAFLVATMSFTLLFASLYCAHLVLLGSSQIIREQQLVSALDNGTRITDLVNEESSAALLPRADQTLRGAIELSVLLESGELELIKERLTQSRFRSHDTFSKLRELLNSSNIPAAESTENSVSSKTDQLLRDLLKQRIAPEQTFGLIPVYSLATDIAAKLGVTLPKRS